MHPCSKVSLQALHLRHLRHNSYAHMTNCLTVECGMTLASGCQSVAIDNIETTTQRNAKPENGHGTACECLVV